MKIVGHAGQGRYLLEATENEIAKAVGWCGTHDDGWQKAKRASHDSRTGLLLIGTTFNVVDAQDFMRRVRANEEEAGRLAKNLHTLADLLTTNLPTTIIPPEPPAADPAPQPETAP